MIPSSLGGYHPKNDLLNYHPMSYTVFQITYYRLINRSTLQARLQESFSKGTFSHISDITMNGD